MQQYKSHILVVGIVAIVGTFILLSSREPPEPDFGYDDFDLDKWMVFEMPSPGSGGMRVNTYGGAYCYGPARPEDKGRFTHKVMTINHREMVWFHPNRGGVKIYFAVTQGSWEHLVRRFPDCNNPDGWGSMDR